MVETKKMKNSELNEKELDKVSGGVKLVSESNAKTKKEKVSNQLSGKKKSSKKDVGKTLKDTANDFMKNC